MSAVALQTPTRAGVAAVARLLARAGLVEAFGHVSARAEERVWITSTAPLERARPEEVLDLSAPRTGAEPEPGMPLEHPLHAAIYARRRDVGAICRFHGRAIAAFAARGEAPPLVHGLGGLAGELAVHDDARLVSTPERASAAADALGAADGLILRANGALSVGATLADAVVRAWYLEERACVALDAGPGVSPLAGPELIERAEAFVAERSRAWAWLRYRFGELQPDGSAPQDTTSQGATP